MKYNIAKYIINTSGVDADLVALGLRSFKRFQTQEEETAQVVMNLQTGVVIDKEYLASLGQTEVVYSFVSQFDNTTSAFIRYSKGYIFAIYSDLSTEYLIKENESVEVITNYNPQLNHIAAFRFGLWVMFGLAINSLGAIAIHSSVVVKDGYGVLCLGESGTGKSTHTRMWRENIEGAKLLNDDSPIIRMVENVPMVFGSPWSGKTPCYINRGFPVRAFMRIVRAPFNKCSKLHTLNALGALLPSCPPAFAYDETLQDNICDTLSTMISKVGVYSMECLPNGEAAKVAYQKLFVNEGD